MKKSFLLGIAFIFFIFSCKSTKVLNEQQIIFLYENNEPFYADIFGIKTSDGIIAIPESEYKQLSEQEKQKIQHFTMQLQQLDTYFAYNPIEKYAIEFTAQSADKINLEVKRTRLIHGKFVEVQDVEKIKEETFVDFYKGYIFINYDNKMRPSKPNQVGITGRWISVDKNNREEFIIPDDIQKVSIEKESVTGESGEFIFVREIIMLNDEKETVNNIVKYYDGKYLYEVIFPLKNVSDDERVIDAINNYK